MNELVKLPVAIPPAQAMPVPAAESAKAVVPASSFTAEPLPSAPTLAAQVSGALNLERAKEALLPANDSPVRARLDVVAAAKTAVASGTLPDFAPLTPREAAAFFTAINEAAPEAVGNSAVESVLAAIANALTSLKAVKGHIEERIRSGDSEYVKVLNNGRKGLPSDNVVVIRDGTTEEEDVSDFDAIHKGGITGYFVSRIFTIVSSLGLGKKDYYDYIAFSELLSEPVEKLAEAQKALARTKPKKWRRGLTAMMLQDKGTALLKAIETVAPDYAADLKTKERLADVDMEKVVKNFSPLDILLAIPILLTPLFLLANWLLGSISPRWARFFERIFGGGK